MTRLPLSPRYGFSAPGVLVLVLALAFALSPLPAAAQGLSLDAAGGVPLEIEASEALEWRAQEQVYVARGNVRLRQGELAASGAVMTVHYQDVDGQPTDITRVVLEGGVVISTPRERAQGDRAEYDLRTEVFRLTGGDLRIDAGEDSLTARDLIEYRQREGIAFAEGGAVARRGDQTITAERMAAAFDEGADGSFEMRQVSAEGNVVLSTDREEARADRVEYDAETETATLDGNVSLARGGSRLQGARAEVNMATGVSRLLADPATGRVTGLLAPERE